MEDQLKTQTPPAAGKPAASPAEGKRRGPRKKDGQTGDEGVIYVLTAESADNAGMPKVIEKYDELRDAAKSSFIHSQAGKPYQLYSMQKLEVVLETTDRGFLVTAEPAKSK